MLYLSSNKNRKEVKMKKIKYLMALVVGAMLLTGCVKFNATMDIKKDKSMDFSIIYALDKTAFGESAKLEEKDFEEVKKEGFTVTKYSEGNFEGFTLSKKISNIDEVSSEKDAEYDLSGLMNSNSENKYIFDTFMKNISNLSNEIFYYYKSKRNCMLNKNKLYELKEMFFENISSCHQINYLNNKYISKDPLDKLIFQESNWKIYEQKFSEETLSQNLNDTIAIFLRPNQEKDLKEKLEFFKKKYSELNDKLNEEEEESIIKEHYELGIIRNFGCDENSYKKTVIVKDVNDNYFKIF